MPSAKGNLSQNMKHWRLKAGRWKVNSLRTAQTVNTMVDQLASFASEVTRVAREVGTEGKLGGQAEVKGVGRYVEGFDRLGELDGGQP